ncbi:queuine tRNA-ribosyltransferase accessory subunit 2 isoform X2 [Orussus abietinus]|uniref:queuine tRNA-ribosyltransferase accessory subunit 2 isoform X2 n=1 Tax=Orussus abietinus TaxID=222816 RepID=UPI00062617FF|nr:queuine tRNA-ribosyltransferase accessory subunit 2 isoform X2 [Orussus abietinus]
MKFLPESAIHCKARLGTLMSLDRSPNVNLQTPLLLLYTKRGSIPHLTKDVLKKVTTDQHLLSISLPTTIIMSESVKQVNSFSEFVGLKEYSTFLSIQDPAYTTQSGGQIKNSVSIWSKSGRYTLTPDKYMDIVEAYKPDLYVALCDGDTNSTSSSKRISKAVERSKMFLEQCLQRHNSSEVLKSKSILGAVEGGYNLNAREASIKHLENKPLTGFIIDGLHNNGPDVQNIMIKEVKDVIQYTIDRLPSDKLRVSMGSWNPTTVLDLIELGVDVFDSSYPYLMTESFQALIFMCDHHHISNGISKHTISVAEKRYADDFSPICNSCECLTCRNHSRAYINHLCHTKELLCMVLLMIHNLHQYLRFFEAIRDHLKQGTFTEFQEKIRSRFLPNPENQLVGRRMYWIFSFHLNNCTVGTQVNSFRTFCASPSCALQRFFSTRNALQMHGNRLIALSNFY